MLNISKESMDSSIRNINMKILHYIPSIDRTSGGTTTYLQLLAKELGKRVELYIVTHASENPVEIENCQVYYIASLRHIREMKRQWMHWLDELEPDVVHVNTCWMPQCALVQQWAQRLGYKVVLSPHGMLEPWIMKRHYWTRKVPALLLYQRKAVRKADYLHATAESEKENLLRLGYNRNVAVVANGIDVEHIALKSTWKRNRQLLFLSRIHVKKGIEFLLEAVAMLKDDLQDYTVNIAGEGEAAYIEQLKAKAQSWGIGPLVRFCGGVYGDEKWKLFRQADLFVLPTYSENFGIVVAEALASGTPVVTTKGTPWEELNTCHCGWWTEIGTKPLAEVLKEFLSLDEKELEVMGRNGRKLVEEKYSAKKMAEDMVRVYENVLCN